MSGSCTKSLLREDMSKSPEKIVQDAFDAHLAARMVVDTQPVAKLWQAVDFEYFQHLPSTSQYLKEQLNSTLSDGRSRVCIAARQTAGVGRRGRAWYSSENCITFSMLATLDIPAASLGGLSLASGVAVAESLNTLCESSQANLTVKWPNDVLAGSAKLCGILTEIPASSAERTTVITGIGVNYVSDLALRGKVDRELAALQDFASPADQASAPLPAREGVIGQLAADVLIAHQQFADSGWQAFAERFSKLDALANKPVSVSQDASIQEGMAVGVAADGRLKVDIGGTVHCFAAGEVTLKPCLLYTSPSPRD